MSTQVNDVEKSKREIERLITDLTKQMKEVFVESFEEINKNFTFTFKELFGGGTASLSLSEPEDILNSGIDIIVHPPGKIVVHLDALSGGEKALVAIALYFAIMKVRPAPFCVMDEIEAALDDVNVDRFANYMRNLTIQRSLSVLLTDEAQWKKQMYCTVLLCRTRVYPNCLNCVLPRLPKNSALRLTNEGMILWAFLIKLKKV